MAEPAGTAQALIFLFPNGDPQRDWTVIRNNDATETIAKFNSVKLGPKPVITQQNITDAAAKRAADKAAADARESQLVFQRDKLKAGNDLNTTELRSLLLLTIETIRGNKAK